MKNQARKTIAALLGWQVRRLYKKNKFQVVAVAGSVGKTSTKLAIAKVLSAGFKTQFQDGNYNDLVSVPLIFFGRGMPSLFNPLAWALVLLKNELSLLRKYPYEVVVVELGSDGPGQLAQFKKYLRADIGVLTGITPEHMEYFGDMQAVAKEELTISELASLTLANKDLGKDLPTNNQILTYAINSDADFKLANVAFNGSGCSFDVVAAGQQIFSADHESFAEPQLYFVLASVAVAYKLGLKPELIKKGLENIKPAPGRMQKLAGLNNSTIIDDTYNASPEAMSAALKTLYRLEAPQKIAILGNMNELGVYSKDAHQAVGRQCDPKQIDLLISIGPDANKYLAPIAQKNGCNVQTFDSPYKAGEFVKKQIKPGALILAKGSQNRVFAEEAVKQLLANPADADKLVRQSKYWLRIKKKAF